MSVKVNAKMLPAKEVKGLMVPILKRLPGYIKLGWMLAKEPSIPLWHRSGIYLTLLYVLSPAHLIANVLPVIGQVDWILMLMASLKQAIAHCPPEVLVVLQAKAGLQPLQLEADMATMKMLFVTSADAAYAAVYRRIPSVENMGNGLVFAGRVAHGFTRRVIGRMRTA